MKKRYERLMKEYGVIAVVTYLSIFVCVITGFAVAIRLGFEPTGMAAGAGTLGAAWLATKVTQPLRILATVVITPVVAGVWRKIRRPPIAPAENNEA